MIKYNIVMRCYDKILVNVAAYAIPEEGVLRGRIIKFANLIVRPHNTEIRQSKLI